MKRLVALIMVAAVFSLFIPHVEASPLDNDVGITMVISVDSHVLPVLNVEPVKVMFMAIDIPVEQVSLPLIFEEGENSLSTFINCQVSGAICTYMKYGQWFGTHCGKINNYKNKFTRTG